MSKKSKKVESGNMPENSKENAEVKNTEAKNAEGVTQDKANEIPEFLDIEEDKKKFRLTPKLKKRMLIIGGSVVGALLIIYFGFAIFFQSHFAFGTKINGVACSGKTVAQAEKKIIEQVEKYEMHITGRDGFQAVISGQDIDLMVVFDGQLEKVKKAQNPFGWIASLFGKKEETVSNAVHFNEESLTEKFEGLECLNNPDATQPVSATLEYKDGSFEIVPEKEGTMVDKEAFKEALWDGIMKLEEEFVMAEKKCYVQPALTSDSKELLQAQKTMNGYLDLEITYSFGDSREVVDGEKISSWVHINEAAEIVFDQEAVRAYIDTLGDKYNTYGKTRSFKTSYNDQIVEITKGHYGWRMNRADETLALIEDIKAGESKEKEPLYLSRAVQYGDDDIGGTYVEVNLTAQHIFLYKDGKLVIESDCVTGKTSNGNGTPEGIDSITYKDKDAVLRGRDYATPVTYWMPFNGNVGLHDATWRKKFGGNIYRNSGSHGCVNLPFSVAKTIFENVEAGTPVIVYSLPGTESKVQETLTPEEQAAAETEGSNAVTYPITTEPTTAAPTTAPTTVPPTTTTSSTTASTTTKAQPASSSETEPSSSSETMEQTNQKTKAAMRTEQEKQKQ